MDSVAGGSDCAEFGMTSWIIPLCALIVSISDSFGYLALYATAKLTKIAVFWHSFPHSCLVAAAPWGGAIKTSPVATMLANLA